MMFVTHQSYTYFMSPHHALLHLKVLLQKLKTMRALARESMQEKTITGKNYQRCRTHTLSQHIVAKEKE